MIKRFIKNIIPKKAHPAFLTVFLIFNNTYGYLRVQRFWTRLFGDAYKRNTQDIEIDITYDCNMKCFNCVRSCRQAPTTTEMMTLEQVRRFVKESVDAGMKWREIRVLGGEPTLHPQFLEILDILIEYKKKHSRKTNIQVVTNGASVRVDKILPMIPKVVEVRNTKKVTHEQHFFAFNKAPMDSRWYRHADFSQGCSTQKLCMIFTPYGYYACAAMPGVDRPLGLDLARKTLPSSDDPMREQFAPLCRYCGFYGYGATLRTNKEVMSPTWKKVYAKFKKSPPKLVRY